MTGFHPSVLQPRKGVVKGPGSGISDSIPDMAAPGTFVMPADSTAAIGQGNLGAMGFAAQAGVPVSLSNGEYKMPPEQVHAVGAQVLSQMKDATHKPVPVSEPLKFANGGVIGDEDKRKTEREVRAQEMAARSAAATAERASWNADYEARGAQMAAEARAAAAQRTQAGALRTYRPEAPAQPATPAPATVVAPVQPAARAAAPQSAVASQEAAPKPLPPAGAAAPSEPAALPNGATAMATNPGVFRSGNTFSDSPEGTAFGRTAGATPREASGFGVSTVPGTPVAPPSPSFAGAAGVDAPIIAHSGNDWEAQNNLRNLRVSASSITNSGVRNRRGEVVGPSPAQQAYADALRADLAARGQQGKADVDAMQANASLGQTAMQAASGIQREQVQQAGADRRAAQQNAIDAQRLGFEQYAKRVELRPAERLEELNKRYEAAKTDEERAAVSRQVRDLSGKSAAAQGSLKDNFMTVGGGQEWDATAGVMRNVPQRLVDLRTSQPVGGGAAQASMPPIESNPVALAIRESKSLTDAQKLEELRKLGYTARK